MVIDCFRDFEECQCSCHEYEGKDGVIAKHIMPCCFKCPHCGKNISATCHLLHEKRCAGEHGVEPKEGS